ncbi:MAG: pyruvate kinase [Flavobacteriales bacterium]|nr:pyruvate kinase [Flavobacteriales bacterium]|tara:strand:+ start:4145 stop:5581 length:1437 start_codon:yes stop_codon:yes gene_type:complete
MIERKYKLKRTKIVATIGPASLTKKKIRKMILAGMNICRINFSHCNHNDAKKIILTINELNIELNSHVAILGDLQGPKLRIGEVTQKTTLKKNDLITIQEGQNPSNKESLFINYVNIIKDIKVGDKILLDDGKIILKAQNSDNAKIHCVVVQGGELKENKGVNLPNTKISIPTITKKDYTDVLFCIKNNIEWLALSFVRSAKDIINLKKIISDHNGNLKVIAKIEKPEAIKNLKSIILNSDALMVARGDLGVEVPTQKVPVLQKKIVRASRKKAKPVIIATQVMDSMINNLSPTRAETNDAANAVFDGADALMLSGETSVGKYPIRVIRIISKIILDVEASDERKHFNKFLPYKSNKRYVSDSICYQASEIANQVEAKAILAFTASGYNAQKISSNRPNAHICVFTHNRKLLNTLSLLWGVLGFYYNKFDSTDNTIQETQNILINENIIKSGDFVVNIASMPIKEKGMTNMLKLEKIK